MNSPGSFAARFPASALVLRAAAFAGLLAGLTGCVSMSKRVEQSALPADWAAALPKSGVPGPDLAGVFVERGEQLAGSFLRDGTIGSAQLSTFLRSQQLQTGNQRQPRSTTTELRRLDDTHLEAITRDGDTVVGRHTLEIEFEKDTGMVALHHGQAVPLPGSMPVAAYATMTTRLWRATDGRLYARDSRRAIGAAVVVPIMVSSETWSRWEPATLGALEKQAAVYAQQDEARRRAAELNRLRPKVGDKAPAFAGTDMLTGRPVADTDFAGKVVVLHSWSTKPGTQPPRALSALHEKFQARGLALVGLSRDPADQRDQVVEFIKARSLPWPQLHDGLGTRGATYQAFHGALPPRYFVIDRLGRIAAIVPTAASLEAVVAAALEAP